MSQLWEPWAPYEQSIVLQYERVFHALVDLVREKGPFKTRTSFIKIHPHYIDDRRDIAISRLGSCFFVRQSATSENASTLSIKHRVSAWFTMYARAGSSKLPLYSAIRVPRAKRDSRKTERSPSASCNKSRRAALSLISTPRTNTPDNTAEFETLIVLLSPNNIAIRSSSPSPAAFPPVGARKVCLLGWNI